MGLFLDRQTILQPIGLITQPNQFGQYPPGASKVVRNFTLRNPGELVQAPDVQSVTTGGAAGDVIHKMIPLDSGNVYVLMVNGTTWNADVSGTNTYFNAPTTNAFSSTGRISWARVAERLILNGTHGCLVGDYMAPSTSDERELRCAGMQEPGVVSAGYANSGDGWLQPGQMVGYRACLVREFSNGYTLRGSPSAPIKVRLASGSASNPKVAVNWSTLVSVAGRYDVRTGDIIELYRTDTLETSSDNPDPGSTYKLVLSHIITSSNQSAQIVTLTDGQPNVQGTLVAPGRELYVNPGQEGENYANRQPPIAKCIESFKGFAFYGYTIEPAQFTFSIPGGWGEEGDAVAAGVTEANFKRYGIGMRDIAGTVTATSATVTAISAADMVGLVVGQRYLSGSGIFPTVPPTTITAVGATSITMSAAATGSGSSVQVVDVLEIDGDLQSMQDAGTFVLGSGLSEFQYECTVTLPETDSKFMQAFEMTAERTIYPLNSNITVRATNGANYSPPLPELSQTVKTLTPITKKNRIQWSKEQQPEHCPSVSEAFIGFGEIYAMNATRDALWIWCSDGLFRLSGNAGAFGQGAWQVDYANSTLLLAAPQASCTMNEFVYAYTNLGFVEVDSAGVVLNMSDRICGDVLPGQKYSETRGIVVERNETDDEVLLMLGDNGSGASNTIYIFNTKQRGWTYLGSNGANLTNITAMAMQRSPTSGEPRVVFGAYDASGYRRSAWNSSSSFLAATQRYQPIYGDDPLGLKRWLWADYLFDRGSDGRNITPTWNGTQYGGTLALQRLDDNACYQRAGCPREVGLSHAVSPGFELAAGSTQSRFQGISVPLKQRTNQSKKR